MSARVDLATVLSAFALIVVCGHVATALVFHRIRALHKMRMDAAMAAFDATVVEIVTRAHPVTSGVDVQRDRLVMSEPS